jgi:hypothetical protein
LVGVVGAGSGRGLAAQNLEHDRAASRAFAFDGLAPVFHRFLDAIGDFALGLAFDAISFCHKNFYRPRFMPERRQQNNRAKFKAQLGKGKR